DGDGNCFYRSILVIMGGIPGGTDYLNRHVFERPEGTELDPGRVLDDVRALRNWLARRLRADFRVANASLPSRYGNFFFDQVGRTREQQQAAWIADAEKMNHWH